MAHIKRDVLYVLGAGASVASGVPAMATFVDKMYDLFPKGSTQDGERVNKVFDAISQLRMMYANSNIDLDNIESVLTTFDMGRLTQSLGTFQKDQSKELYDALVRLIVRTVEETTMFDSVDSAITVIGHYTKFVHEAIKTCR